jgi:hypothetical protein
MPERQRAKPKLLMRILSWLRGALAESEGSSSKTVEVAVLRKRSVGVYIATLRYFYLISWINAITSAPRALAPFASFAFDSHRWPMPIKVRTNGLTRRPYYDTSELRNAQRKRPMPDGDLIPNEIASKSVSREGPRIGSSLTHSTSTQRPIK